jgi:hypothetical protein
MMIREPLVQATYYYLREAPGDSPARRRDRHEAFAADVYRIMQGLSGWLALPAPERPLFDVWEAEPPRYGQPLMETRTLEGRTNASAQLAAYALRNMLLLRVIVSRAGEHEQTVWTMLDETLNGSPTTASWLHTTRYWCGVAPRLPEDVELERQPPIRTAFGVLCLGDETRPHVLVYPDARTETRANAFLSALAGELDWYTVQARYRRDAYDDHASQVTRNQQRALEQVSRTTQAWAIPAAPGQPPSLDPLRSDLDALESTYAEILDDLRATRAAAQEMRTLASEYRRALMQHGLWDTAPTVWQARIAHLEDAQAQIEADMQHIDSTLRRIELMTHTLHTRAVLLRGEQTRWLFYLLAALGIALLTVLIADTNVLRMIVRVLALAAVTGAVWYGWQQYQRRSS